MADEIRMLVVDVDGTLTDGFYHVTDTGTLMKSFYTRDVWAIEELLKAGFRVMIITQASDNCVTQKFARMQIRRTELSIVKGVEDKVKFIESILESRGFTWENVAYIGDAENDLECIKLAGWSTCPRDAVPIIKENVTFVCDADGGRGAVHEFANDILGFEEG